MTVDPKVTFYIGLVTCVALVCSEASVWTWISPEYVPIISGANALIGKVGTAVMTFLAGVSGRGIGPVAMKMGWH